MAHTAVTFEYDVPDTVSFRTRIRDILKNYPFLVAAEGERILGYAYAHAFYGRAAYRHTAEPSIYLDGSCRRQGIGRRLYEELEKRLLQQHVYVLYACISFPDRRDDPFLTDGSIRFHEQMGYTAAGEHRLCGYKFGRWYSVRWMEKNLAERPETPAPFIPFPELEEGARVRPEP